MSVTHPSPAGRPIVGVALVALAVLAFAIADVTTKHLMTRFPLGVVVAMRYLISLVLLLAILWPRHRSRLWRTERTGLVVLRGLVLAFASLTLSYALHLMPVGETISIIYLAPFAVMLLAVPLLGEKVSAVGWIGALVGFSGVLLIMRPGGGLDPVGVAFAVINAGAATAYHLLTRLLTRTESTVALLFHVTLVGSIVFSVMALGSLGERVPDAGDVALMLLLGIAATIGHFLFTAAYREAAASLLAPVNYLHLVWATVLGWLVFNHVPTGLTLVGMALVVLSGAAVAAGARR